MSSYDAGSTQAMAQIDQASQEIVVSGVDQARRYAALSGPFNPVLALRSIDGIDELDPERLTTIAAGLSRTCDRSTTERGDRWLMRGAERRRTLDALARSEQLPEAIAHRRGTAEDEATRDLLNAIDGADIFSVDEITTALTGTPDRDRLERLVVGLGRAGALAPQYGLLPAIKAALTHLDFVSAADAVQSREFVGRDEEMQQIIDWLDAEAPAVPAAAFYIEGLPGIGKTTLVEQVAARLLDPGDDWVVVRFDFDRAGLDVQDYAGLTLELARQVSAQLSGAEGPIQQARLKAAGTSPGTEGLKGNSPDLVPEDLGLALANALASPRRRIFLVLDTLEVLRARGATHPGRLFNWIDQLASVAKVSIAVVGAGRGQALDDAPNRLGVRLPLGGLSEAGADHLLHSLQVDAGSHRLIRAIAGGNPLTLRLAAKIAIEHGAAVLAKAGKRGELVSAALYRFLLSRIDDPDLKSLANPGLVVRRINADVIREVIAPQVGLGRLTPERADELFNALATQHWLVEPGPADGFLRHRPDMRAVLLPVLYESAPAKSARIDRAAARWFGAREENWCQVEAAYHRLQLMRKDPAVPPIPPAIMAQLDPVTILELPTVAQDVVHRFQGDRTTSFRGDRVAPGTALDPNAVDELRSMNDRSDWLEGNYVYDRAFVGAVFDPDSAGGDVALTFLWRSGKWSAARKLLAQQKGGWHRPALARQLTEDRLNALCRLEMGAELDFDHSVRAFREPAGIGYFAAEQATGPSVPGLAGAGLRFAVNRAEVPLGRRLTADAASTAIRRWQSLGGDDFGPVDPPGPGRTRITARIGPVDVGRANAAVVEARELAVLSPFADLVGTMRQLPDHQYLAEYAAVVRERLNELGNLAPLGSPPWRDYVDTSPALALQSLTDLGLLAELIGAAAYIRRDRDLTLVARSAERWRRTVAGSWSYGTATRPRGWDRPVDVSIADRISVMVLESDAFDRAEAQLRAWCPEQPQEGDVLGLLRKRAPATIDAARLAAAEGTVADAAAVLLRRNLPSAFVPGIAVLVGHNGEPYRVPWPTIHIRPDEGIRP
ncbi:MAG: hypothetical protein QOH84_609 [Kribbellaceae bacterium]|nr:hypothetical protein [Kribbellaceae bacterium]